LSNPGSVRIFDICDGTAGTFNYCHLELRPGVSGPTREVLSGVRHGDTGYSQLCQMGALLWIFRRGNGVGLAEAADD